MAGLVPATHALRRGEEVRGRCGGWAEPANVGGCGRLSPAGATPS